MQDDASPIAQRGLSAAALRFGADAHGLLRGHAQFKTQPTMVLKTTIPVSQAKAPMVRPTRAVTA